MLKNISHITQNGLDPVMMLLNTNRPNIDKLTEYLQANGFYSAPASTKFHGNYEGGLKEHCLNLYLMFKTLCREYEIDIKDETIVIAALLHDVCKLNAYIKQGDSYTWNGNNPKGHAKLSLERVKQFIELTPQEENLIKYHMGWYGTTAFSANGEYTTQELAAVCNNDKAVKLFYFCDDMCSMFLEVKK